MAAEMAKRPFILASASPRRLDLLQQIGMPPDEVVPAEIDESVQSNEAPAAYARRMAAEKAMAIRAARPDALILGADTVVACGRRILPKAEDLITARQCLEMLSGRRHKVVGGVCVLSSSGGATRLVTTTVKIKRLSRVEISDYLATSEWSGKAGGYAIQGRAARFVNFLSGSYSNVVGLPLHETYALLSRYLTQD